jgi:hypothetical protein
MPPKKPLPPTPQHTPPGHNNAAFERQVLESLNRIEKKVDILTDSVQVIDQKIDLLTAKVDECCEEDEPARPTGVRINQLIM